MNSKGFTLFTALVAFILIIVSLLLIQSMTSTERSISDIISDISEQQEMQAIADLSRADALQVFNYGIRYSIEEYSTREDGGEYVMFQNSETEWDKMQKEFVKDRFGVGESGTGREFSLRTARHLIDLLERTEDSRGYTIDLENPDESAWADILQSTFDNQANQGEFFEVIDCPTGSFTNCTGTFYITIDLSPESMTDAQYEKFPLIRVHNRQTGRILKEPILPRGKFRSYVPVRLFKALAAAREISPIVFSTICGTATDTRARLAIALSGVRGSYNHDDFELIEVDEDVIAPTSLSTGGTSPTATAERIEVTLTFEERDPQYMVSSLGGTNQYKITLKKYC